MSNIQNLPPLSSIKDPAVRSYLQALQNAWQVRNGDVGTGEDKFVTVKELTDGVTLASKVIQTGQSINTAQVPFGTSAVAGAFQAVTASIEKSKAWKYLAERVTSIETPSWFQKQFGAEIQTNQSIIESDIESVAEQVTTAVSKFDSNVAMVQESIRTMATATGASAEAITTLQLDVGTAQLAAEQAFNLATDVNGSIAGHWGVKFDADGYVTGFGLSLDGTQAAPKSTFAVRADNFVIGDATTETMPFIVSGGMTYINGGLIVGDSSLNTIAANASVPPITSLGEFASAPGTLDLQKNNVYKNTLDGNTYILVVDTNGNKSWVLWIPKGGDGTNGVDGIAGGLSNESHSVPCDVNGTVTVTLPAGAVTTMSVFKGATDDSANWSFNATYTSCTCTQSNLNRTQTLASMSADVAYVDITATRSGYASITKRFTVTKSKQGTQGPQGYQGPQGPQGYQGNDGPRGSLRVQYTGTYSNGTTTSSIFQSATGLSTRVMGDAVSFSGSGEYRRTANNSDVWDIAALYVNGNLIVDGTIYANKISLAAASADVYSNTSTVTINTATTTLATANTPAYTLASGEAAPEVVAVASVIITNNSGALRTYTAKIMENGSVNHASNTFTVTNTHSFMMSFVAKIAHRSANTDWMLTLSSDVNTATQTAKNACLYVSRIRAA